MGCVDIAGSGAVHLVGGASGNIPIMMRNFYGVKETHN